MALERNSQTTLTLLDLKDKLTNSIDNNEITNGIFIDLAFGTVNHNVFKLYHYDVRGITCEWFQNYLSNRTQYVNFNN